MTNEFFFEELHTDNFFMKYKVNKVLFQGKSAFQTVDIIETKDLGRMLINDGIVMVSEKDEFIYHDMISHIPLFTHPHPKKVLVIGGGDGGTAREVLRHSSVEKCTMVEIDEMVVNACREFLPQMSCSFKEPRLELLIADGVEYMATTNEKFDVILVDSTDPIGPSQPLFGAAFYQDVFRCLEEQGIVVSQAESIFYNGEVQTELLSILSEIFPVRSLYNYQNLTYPGSPWSFSFASKGPHPLGNFDPVRVDSCGLQFCYYNKLVHIGAFALPSFQWDKVKQYLSSEG